MERGETYDYHSTKEQVHAHQAIAKIVECQVAIQHSLHSAMTVLEPVLHPLDTEIATREFHGADHL